MTYAFILLLCHLANLHLTALVAGDPEGWVSEFGSKFQGKTEDEEEAEWFESFQKKEALRQEENKEILAELSQVRSFTRFFYCLSLCFPLEFHSSGA
jgi:hypothetical protein